MESFKNNLTLLDLNMIIGRDSDGVPITAGTLSDILWDKYAYTRAAKIAEDMSFENLETWLQGMDAAVKEMNPILRFIYQFEERINPDVQTMAIREVYERRKKMQPYLQSKEPNQS
jgi:hypothetical protein